MNNSDALVNKTATIPGQSNFLIFAITSSTLLACTLGWIQTRDEKTLRLSSLRGRSLSWCGITTSISVSQRSSGLGPQPFSIHAIPKWCKKMQTKQNLKNVPGVGRNYESQPRSSYHAILFSSWLAHRFLCSSTLSYHGICMHHNQKSWHITFHSVHLPKKTLSIPYIYKKKQRFHLLDFNHQVQVSACAQAGVIGDQSCAPGAS